MRQTRVTPLYSYLGVTPTGVSWRGRFCPERTGKGQTGSNLFLINLLKRARDTAGMKNGGWSLKYVDATQYLVYNYKAMGDHDVPTKFYEECKSVLISIPSINDSKRRQLCVASAESSNRHRRNELPTRPSRKREPTIYRVSMLSKQQMIPFDAKPSIITQQKF